MLQIDENFWLRHCMHIPCNVPFSWTTRVSRFQKGESNLDFTE